MIFTRLDAKSNSQQRANSTLTSDVCRAGLLQLRSSCGRSKHRVKYTLVCFDVPTAGLLTLHMLLSCTTTCA